MTRTARTSQVLHGYSKFPGLRQAVEITRHVEHLCGGEVVHATDEIEYGITSLSPAQASAKTLMSLFRRHWHIENRSHHVRDDGWREDRRTWRCGHGYTMFILLSIALNMLHAPSPHWADGDSLIARAEKLDYLLTADPAKVLRKGP